MEIKITSLYLDITTFSQVLCVSMFNKHIVKFFPFFMTAKITLFTQKRRHSKSPSLTQAEIACHSLLRL